MKLSSLAYIDIKCSRAKNRDGSNPTRLPLDVTASATRTGPPSNRCGYAPQHSSAARSTSSELVPIETGCPSGKKQCSSGSGISSRKLSARISRGRILDGITLATMSDYGIIPRLDQSRGVEIGRFYKKGTKRKQGKRFTNMRP